MVGLMGQLKVVQMVVEMVEQLADPTVAMKVE